MLRQAIQWWLSEEPTPAPGSDRAMEPEEGTPSDVLLTTAERSVVMRSTRVFVKGIVPHLPALAKFGGPALGFVLLMLQHWSGKAETDKDVHVSWAWTADKAEKQDQEIAELKRAVAQLADSNALQARLALASRPGFDDKGKPQTTVVVAAHGRRAKPLPTLPQADPILVKKVVEDAKKNVALQARLVVERPPAIALPHTLPTEAPKAVAEPWPPPVPVPTPPPVSPEKKDSSPG